MLLRYAMKINIYLIYVAIVGLFLNSATASELPSPLVETNWLANNIHDVTIIDVRADQTSFTSEPKYKKDKKSGKLTLIRVGGHIPGARLVRYKNVRGVKTINNVKIKHMLPSKSDFEKLMRKTGTNQNDNIVIATNAESNFDLTMASRMYWQLKYFGHDKVAILNGGTAQWLLDNRKYSTKASNSSDGNWTAKKERQELLADSDEVLSAIENDMVQLVDVRPLGQYLGTYKSSKVKDKGHIPTAKTFPVDLTASRSMPVVFSSTEELLKIISALGINSKDAAITYCNSGHMASGAWFVLHEILGNQKAKLYDGSMHQWTKEKRPVVSMIME